MIEKIKAPAQRQLHTGRSTNSVRQEKSDYQKISQVTCNDKRKARQASLQAAKIWAEAKSETAQGLARGVRPSCIPLINARRAMQAGQRGDLHALEAWRIAHDVSCGVLRGVWS